MLQKIAAPARRSYTWICSDCRKRLGLRHPAGQHTAAFSALNGSGISSAPARRAAAPHHVLWRARPGSLGAGAEMSGGCQRRYSTNAVPGDDEEQAREVAAEEDEELAADEARVEEVGGDSADGVFGLQEGYNPDDTDFQIFADSLPAGPGGGGQEDGREGEFFLGDRQKDRQATDDTPAPPTDPPQLTRRVMSTSAADKPTQEPAKESEGIDVSKFRKGPMTREVLFSELEKLNAGLVKAGYELQDPKTKGNHNRVVTRNQKVTPGHAQSLWQKFTADYTERYRQGDPAVLMGRPPGYRPTGNELRLEYKRFFIKHKEELRKTGAWRKHWWDAPDLLRCFSNTLWMLERQTDPETLARHKPGSRSSRTKLVPHGEGYLSDLVRKWQEQLEVLDPTSYKPVDHMTATERQNAMEQLKYFKSHGTQPSEIKNFRTVYLQDIDAKSLGEAYGVPLTSFPASGKELLALLYAMSYQRISKQDSRHVLPAGYPDMGEFVARSMISLIVAHERNKVLNTSIFNIAISYMMRTNQIKKGRHLIDYMEYLQISMNQATWREALRAAAKARDLFVFEHVVKRMILKKVNLNDEVWRDFLECAHTPGQRLQIFELMMKLGMDPKLLAPIQLIHLAFKMYDDQLRGGNARAEVPWRHLAGIPLRFETLNVILEHLYHRNAHKDARDFLFAAVKMGVGVNYTTLRIIARAFNRTRNRLMEMVKLVWIFEKKYNIFCNGDVMEVIFRTAHVNRQYNVVRTVWAHACLTNQATKRMIDRMRHDIYETGKTAGKAGKLALGVCSEDTEMVVKTPVWAMRLVSMPRDRTGYLVSEGAMYQEPSAMRDFYEGEDEGSKTQEEKLQAAREFQEKLEGRRTMLREFRKQAVNMRKRLLQEDLLAHLKWKPRCSFALDLLRAARKDRLVRMEPQLKEWTPLEWAWSMYQVTRVPRPADSKTVTNLDWQKLKLKAAIEAGDQKEAHRRWVKCYNMLEGLPPNWSQSVPDPAAEAEVTVGDLKMPYTNNDKRDHNHDGGDQQPAEHEAEKALDETLEEWDEEPLEYEAVDDEIAAEAARRGMEEDRAAADDTDRVDTGVDAEAQARRAAAVRADQVAEDAKANGVEWGPGNVDNGETVASLVSNLKDPLDGE